MKRWLLPFAAGVLVTLIALALFPRPTDPPIPAQSAPTATPAPRLVTRAGNGRLPADLPVIVLERPSESTVRVQTLDGAATALLDADDVYTPADQPTPTAPPEYLFWRVGDRLFTLVPLGAIPAYTPVTLIRIDGATAYLVRNASGAEAAARADQLTDR